MAPRWKHTSEEERKRIIKLYLQGKSYRAIEKETGRCLRTCINVVKDYERNHIVKTQRKSSQGKPHRLCSNLLNIRNGRNRPHIAKKFVRNCWILRYVPLTMCRR